MLHRSTKIIAATGTLSLLGGFILLALFFRIVSIQKAEFIELTLAQVRAEEHNEELSLLMRTLDETKEERERLYSRILKEEEVIGFLSLIESIGKEQNVRITKNGLIEEPIDKTFQTLVMKMDVEGSYESVMQVLKIFEHLPYQSSIQGFRLMKEDREEGVVWKSQYDVRVTQFLTI